MKIKIVVRPEDANAADAAAETARRERVRRSRLGLIALSALVALGAAIAIFYWSGGQEPDERAGQETPAAGKPVEKPAAAGGSDVAGASAALSGNGRENGTTGGAAPGGSGAEPQTPADQEPRAAQEAQRPAATAPVDAATDQTGADDGAAPTPESADGAADAPDTAAGAAGTPGAPADESGAPASNGAGPVARPAPASAARSGSATGAAAPRVETVPAKPSAKVARAQLTSRVAGREPVDVLRSPVEIGQRGRTVYYYTELRNLNGQTVTHRWELDGQEMAAIPFKIGGNRWRVYSSKYIAVNRQGRWRVSVVDKNGAVLASAEFVTN